MARWRVSARESRHPHPETDTERSNWREVLGLRHRLADAKHRAVLAERAVRAVADLAAQHLADTRPRDGRPPVLGTLAGGPAVAHFAELVLSITGPPPGHVDREPAIPLVDDAPIEERVRAGIAARLRARQQRCPDFRHTSEPGRSSCWTCGSNTGLRVAESIALGRWNLPAGQEKAGGVPEYGTDAYRWWLAGIRRAHQLATAGVGDAVLDVLEAAENLARRRPDATAAAFVAELGALYPPAPGSGAARPPRQGERHAEPGTAWQGLRASWERPSMPGWETKENPAPAEPPAVPSVEPDELEVADPQQEGDAPAGQDAGPCRYLSAEPRHGGVAEPDRGSDHPADTCPYAAAGTR